MPEFTPEVHKAAVLQFGEDFPGSAKQQAMDIDNVLKGTTEGTMPLNDPAIGRVIGHLSPTVLTRGINEVLKAPIMQDGKEIVPAGATIVGKEGRSFVPVDGGRLTPMLTVHAVKDGKAYSYEAPVTVNGTSDPNDPVLALPVSELKRQAMAKRGAADDEAFLRGWQDYVAMTRSAKEREEAIKLQGTQYDVEEKKLKLQQLKEAARTGRGKDDKRPEADTKKSSEFFATIWGQPGGAEGAVDEEGNLIQNPRAEAFVKSRFKYDNVTMPRGDFSQTALETAGLDAVKAHVEHPDVPMDTINSAILTGTWTKATVKEKGGAEYWGYKLPTGEFMRTEPTGKPVEKSKESKQAIPTRK